MQSDVIYDKLRDGSYTVDELADSLDSDKSSVQIILRTLEDYGLVTSERIDHKNKIKFKLAQGVTEDDFPSVIAPKDDIKSEDTQRMPVNRDYNFDERIPTNVPEYYQNEDEKDRIMAEIEHRNDSGRLPRFWLSGPTGTAKTTLARRIALEMDAPLFTIQGKYSMSEADIIGSPMLINQETWWSDGPLPRALLASNEKPVVLLIDEANRARPEAKGALFPILDDRAELILEKRGDERITGNPMNLIVFATTNEGPGYFNEKLDLAEKRRIGNKYLLDFLGMGDEENENENRDREARLIANRTPAPEELAVELVNAANAVRREARTDGSEIRRGIPTAMLLSWAQTAYTYSTEGFHNPVVSAATVSILNPFYDENDSEYETVEETIRSSVNNAPFDAEEFSDWAEADMNSFVSTDRSD